MTAVTRVTTITYGAVTIGGTPYHLHLPFGLQRTYRSLSVSAEVVVTAASSAALKAAEDTLRAEFGKPRQNLTINLGGSSVTYSESDNSGFNITPTCTRVQGSPFQGASALYRITIELGLPADLSGENHLASVTVEVDKDASNRRQVTITGEYTAVDSGNDARAQYDARIATDADTYLDAIDNTADWKLVARETSGDKKDFTLGFRHVYRERAFRQSITADNVAEIIDDSLEVTVLESSPGDSFENVSRAVTVNVSYRAIVDREQSTDLLGIFTGTVRPLMIAQALAATSGSLVAVVGVSPNLNYQANTIAASMSLIVQTGSGLISAVLTETIRETKGVSFVPVDDGNAHSYFVLETKGRIVKESTVAVEVIGNADEARAQATALLPSPSYSPSQFGPGDGLAQGLGGAILPAATPDFGGSAGDFVQFDRSEPETQTLIIGAVPNQVTVTRHIQSVASLYVATPAGLNALGV